LARTATAPGAQRRLLPVRAGGAIDLYPAGATAHPLLDDVPFVDGGARSTCRRDLETRCLPCVSSMFARDADTVIRLVMGGENARATAIPTRSPAQTITIILFDIENISAYCRNRRRVPVGLPQVDARLGVVKQTPWSGYRRGAREARSARSVTSRVMATPCIDAAAGLGHFIFSQRQSFGGHFHFLFGRLQGLVHGRGATSRSIWSLRSPAWNALLAGAATRPRRRRPPRLPPSKIGTRKSDAVRAGWGARW